jgi:protein-disulfide isomerase
MGANSAKVTIVEFSDYECPWSSEYFNWTMRDIVRDYVKTGKVKYVYRDFPIESIHPLALKAAEGARCAGDQGKYWEMHDRFFRNQSSIEPKILPLHAQMLGLNVAKFQQCLDSGTYTAKVRESVAEGEEAGVRGTPGFFLGLTDPNEPKLRALIYIEGRQPYQVFKEAIDKLLSTPSLVISP